MIHEYTLTAQDGTKIGSLEKHELPDRAILARLWVHPDHRGRGLSRRLLESAVADADRDGVTLESNPWGVQSVDDEQTDRALYSGPGSVPNLDPEHLEALYGSVGFAPEHPDRSGYDRWVRQPQGSLPAVQAAAVTSDSGDEWWRFSSRLPGSSLPEDVEARERFHRRKIKRARQPDPRNYVGPNAPGEDQVNLIRNKGVVSDGSSRPEKLEIGNRVYLRKGKSWGDISISPSENRKAHSSTDSEYLYHHVAEAFGALHPDVILSPRPDDRPFDQIYTEWIPSLKSALHGSQKVMHKVIAPGSRNIALFHAAAGMHDHVRNNWGIIDEGDGYPITFDHEGSVIEDDLKHGTRTFPSSDFTDVHHLTVARRGGLLPKNDITLEEYETYRDRLARLSSKFAKRGRSDWHDELMGRWDDMWKNSKYNNGVDPMSRHGAREQPTWENRMQEPNLFVEFGSEKAPGLSEHTIHYSPTGHGAACGNRNPEGSSNNVDHVTCASCRFTRSFKMAPTEYNPRGKTWDQVEREDRQMKRRRYSATDEPGSGNRDFDWEEAPPGRGIDPKDRPDSEDSWYRFAYEGDTEWQDLGQMRDAKDRTYNVRWKKDSGRYVAQAVDPKVDHSGHSKGDDHEAVISWSPYNGEIAWRGAAASHRGAFVSMFLKDHLMEHLPPEIQRPHHSTNLTGAGRASLEAFMEKYGDRHGDIDPALDPYSYDRYDDDDREDYDDESDEEPKEEKPKLSEDDRNRLSDHGFVEDNIGQWNKDFVDPHTGDNIESHTIQPDGRLEVYSRGQNGKMRRDREAGTDYGQGIQGALDDSNIGFAERNLPKFGWTPHYKDPAFDFAGFHSPSLDDPDRFTRHHYPYKWTKTTEAYGDAPYHSTITSPDLGGKFRLRTSREGRNDRLEDHSVDPGDLIWQEGRWSAGKHPGGRMDNRLTHDELRQAVNERFGVEPGSVHGSGMRTLGPGEEGANRKADYATVPSGQDWAQLHYDWDSGRYSGRVNNEFHRVEGRQPSLISEASSAISDESDLKAAGIAVIALDTGRVLMQQRALNPILCPCGQGVTWDEQNGWQHDDGSVDHDEDEFYGQSVSDLLDQGHPIEKEAMPRDESFLHGLRYELGKYYNGYKFLDEVSAFDNNGNKVGHIRWNRRSGKPEYDGVIQHIHVEPQYRRKGLATELYNRAVEAHRENPEAILYPVHDWEDLSNDAEGWIQNGLGQDLPDWYHDYDEEEDGLDKTAALDHDPNEGTWEFPGGKLDPGESARAAAVREFREEVGQDLPPGVFVGAWLAPGGIVVSASVDKSAMQPFDQTYGFQDLSGHTAPSDRSYAVPLHDVESMMPGFYEGHHNDYSHGNAGDAESVSKILQYHNQPEKKIRIYRAVPHGISKIYGRQELSQMFPNHDPDNLAEWVGISKDYALEHARSQKCPKCGGNLQVISGVAQAKDLLNEGYPTEWGYVGDKTLEHTGSNRIYKTKCPEPRWKPKTDEQLEAEYDEISGQGQEAIERWEAENKRDLDYRMSQKLRPRRRFRASELVATAAPGKVDPEYQREFHEWLEREVGYSPEDFAALSPSEQRDLADGFGHYVGEEHPRDARYHLDVGGAGYQRVRSGRPGTTVRVLRIEKPDGSGPFAYGGGSIPQPYGNDEAVDPDLYSLLNPRQGEDEHRVKQRQPNADGIPLRYVRGRVFGFLPQHDVHSYFTPKMLQGLHERGFGVSEYDVPGESLVLGRTQVAWRPEDATRVSHSSLKKQAQRLLPSADQAVPATNSSLQPGFIQSVTDMSTDETMDPNQAMRSAADPQAMAMGRLASVPLHLQPEPEFHAGDDIDEHTAKHRAWKKAVRRALAMGELSPEQARANGYWGTGHDQGGPSGLNWKPLPHTLYHVTTDLPSVMREGIKNRDELNQDLGKGLGGGESDTISYTDDPKVAQRIHEALHEFHDVLNGKKTMREMYEEAKSGEGAERPWADFIHGVDYSGDPNNPALAAHLEGKKYQGFGLVHTQAEMDEEYPGEGWEPHPSAGMSWDTPRGRVHLTWQRPMTEDELRDRRAAFYKTWAAGRMYAGGPEDPMFFTTDTKGFSKMDPKNFGIVKVHPIPGAQGYPVSALGEWRSTTGQNVTIDPDQSLRRESAAKKPVYKGFIYLIQSERDIDLGNREIANPDDPDGDMSEQSAWWDIEHAKKNPALRPEVKKGTPWDELELWADKSVRTNRQVTSMLAKLAESEYAWMYDADQADDDEDEDPQYEQDELFPVRMPHHYYHAMSGRPISSDAQDLFNSQKAKTERDVAGFKQMYQHNPDAAPNDAVRDQQLRLLGPEWNYTRGKGGYVKSAYKNVDGVSHHVTVMDPIWRGGPNNHEAVYHHEMIYPTGEVARRYVGDIDKVFDVAEGNHPSSDDSDQWPRNESGRWGPRTRAPFQVDENLDRRQDRANRRAELLENDKFDPERHKSFPDADPSVRPQFKQPQFDMLHNSTITPMTFKAGSISGRVLPNGDYEWSHYALPIATAKKDKNGNRSIEVASEGRDWPGAGGWGPSTSSVTRSLYHKLKQNGYHVKWDDDVLPSKADDKEMEKSGFKLSGGDYVRTSEGRRGNFVHHRIIPLGGVSGGQYQVQTYINGLPKQVRSGPATITSAHEAIKETNRRHRKYGMESAKTAAPLTQDAPRINQVIRSGERGEPEENWGEGARVHDVKLPSGDWIAKSPQYRFLNDAEYHQRGPGDVTYFLDRAGEGADLEEFASRLGKALSNPSEEPIAPEAIRGHKASDPSPTVYVRKYPDFSDLVQKQRPDLLDLKNEPDADRYVDTPRGKLIGYFHSVLGEGDHKNHHNMGLVGGNTLVSIDHTGSSLPLYVEAKEEGNPEFARSMRWHHEFGLSPYEDHFLRYGKFTTPPWETSEDRILLRDTNPLAPGDTERALAASETMRPWAQQRGRESWLDAAQERMRLLGERAGGTKSLFPYQMAHEQQQRTAAPQGPSRAAWSRMHAVIAEGRPDLVVRTDRQVPVEHHDRIVSSRYPEFHEERDYQSGTPKLYGLRAGDRNMFLAPVKNKETGEYGWLRGPDNAGPDKWTLYPESELDNAIRWAKPGSPVQVDPFEEIARQRGGWADENSQFKLASEEQPWWVCVY